MTDILKVVGHYIDLTEQGDLHVACCPFHGEATPSFKVYPDTDSWCCYGACAGTETGGGDAIAFVMNHEGVSYKESIEIIAGIMDVTETEVKKGFKKKKDSSNSTKKKVTFMSKDELEEFRKDKTYKGGKYRGIKDEYRKEFGHLFKLDADKKPIAVWYPETVGNRISGYKCRNLPKDFSYGKVGTTGVKCDLSGQVRFKKGDKYVLIVGGEEDQIAAYQMLRENQKSRNQGDYSPVPVVSPTAGEGSAAKQCANHYDWFDQFDNILIGMDNDEAGRAAAEAICEVLPKEKIKIVTWSMKDPSKMLQSGKGNQFLRDFYGGKELIPSGIVTSNELMGDVFDHLVRPKIPLPEYMNVLQDKMKGGIIQGRIVNIIADTSVGKSTHVNACVYKWIFDAPETVGIVSLEMTGAEYALDMLSLHLERNLAWFMEGQDVVDYLQDPEVQILYDDLWNKPNGEPRFVLLDERGGGIKLLEKQIERLVKQYGCKIIVIDVLTDILRGSSADLQEDHMMWQKTFAKNGITIINVLHTRKPANGEARETSEYDAYGSSTFVQSAHINIVLDRDKNSDDSVEKNTTKVRLPKCRGGNTGDAGAWFYDTDTRKCYDFDTFFKVDLTEGDDGSKGGDNKGTT